MTLHDLIMVETWPDLKNLELLSLFRFIERSKFKNHC